MFFYCFYTFLRLCSKSCSTYIDRWTFCFPTPTNEHNCTHSHNFLKAVLYTLKFERILHLNIVVMSKVLKTYPKEPRKHFSCDDFQEKPRFEPPAPTSDFAQNKVPPSYEWSKLAHPDIIATRANKLFDAGVQGKASGWSDLRMDWKSDAAAAPASYPYFVRGRDSTRKYITELFNTEVAMYDGAMGTMIQKQGKWLDETAFRGERFADWTSNVKGNNDLLTLTQPQVIKNIYLEYLHSGSRLIGTNTFSATTIAQADYKMEHLAYELNYAGARLAREACDEVTAADPTRPRFVVGALGPTNRTGSISPSVEDSAFRNVTFDELVKAYYEQAVALVDGGADGQVGHRRDSGGD